MKLLFITGLLIALLYFGRAYIPDTEKTWAHDVLAAVQASPYYPTHLLPPLIAKVTPENPTKRRADLILSLKKDLAAISENAKQRPSGESATLRSSLVNAEKTLDQLNAENQNAGPITEAVLRVRDALFSPTSKSPACAPSK